MPEEHLCGILETLAAGIYTLVCNRIGGTSAKSLQNPLAMLKGAILSTWHEQIPSEYSPINTEYKSTKQN